MSRLISFVVLIAIIIIIGLLFYKVLIGFFIPVFLASVLVVVFRPLHTWVLDRTGHRDRLAAVLTCLLIMLAIFLPIAVVGGAAAAQGLRLIKQNDQASLQIRIERIQQSLGLEMPEYEGRIRTIEDEIQNIVKDSSGTLLSEEDEKLIRIASATKRTLSQLQTDVEKEDGKEKWKLQFEELNTLLDRVGRTRDETSVGMPQPALELRAKFADFRSELLGGGLIAIARDMANPTPDDTEQFYKGVVEYVQPRLLSITGVTGTFIVKFLFGSVILIVATFFFLYDGPSMVKAIMRLSPLDDAYEQELLLEFDRISRAVVLATLLSAIVQGVTAGIGYAVAGVGFLTLLIMLTTVFAMVPFVGPAVVWVPVCLYLGVYEERYTAALLLAAWGVLVVGTVDNLVKAFVLHGQSQLHPLLALLSVLGGVQALGPVGIVVGPMVVAMLQTLLSILQRELTHFDKQLVGVPQASGDPANRKVSKRKSQFRMRKKEQKERSTALASLETDSEHAEGAGEDASDTGEPHGASHQADATSEDNKTAPEADN